MPHITRFAGAAAFAIVIATTPAAAEPRNSDGKDGYSEASGKAWKKKRYSKYEKHKRLRYAQQRRYRYYYPWTDWWGPFAGPPGL